MTDEQIIKAFEEILKNQNNKLSLIERAVCDDVLSLANRQKAEIEELYSDKIIAETHEKAAKDLFVDCVKQREEARAEIKELKDILEKVPTNAYDLQVESSEKLENQIKSEAIKEFAVKLKNGVPQETGVIRCKDIDDLVKEMTEVQK